MKMTKEGILKAVCKGAKNLSDIWHIMGGKGNVSGSTTKKIRELVPGIGGMVASNANLKKNLKKGLKQEKPSKAVKPGKTVKTVKKPKVSMKAKLAAFERFKATGNPFTEGTMKAIVFEHGSKDFISIRELCIKAANDPRFMALSPKMPLGDMNGGRYRQAYWKVTEIKLGHLHSHGATNWIAPEGETRKKGHERLVKAVVLIDKAA